MAHWLWGGLGRATAPHPGPSLPRPQLVLNTTIPSGVRNVTDLVTATLDVPTLLSSGQVRRPAPAAQFSVRTCLLRHTVPAPVAHSPAPRCPPSAPQTSLAFSLGTLSNVTS